jgi:radical SAM protein with 4Fe4S-binding SPASM domain
MKELKKQDIYQSLDKFHSEGVKEIYYLGGEPFSRADFFEILEYTHQRGIRSAVVTNGTLLGENDLERLLTIGVFKVHFSIDGAVSSTHDWNRGRGTFKKTTQAVKILSTLRQQYDSDIELGLNFVMTQMNMHEIEAIVELADELNVQVVIPLAFGGIGAAKANKDILDPSVSQIIDTLERASKKIASINRARAAERLPLLLLDAHMYPRKVVAYLNDKYSAGVPVLDSVCGAGITSLYVAPDGTVTPCDGAYFLRNPLEEAIGKYEFQKIQDHELDDIIDSSFFSRAILFFHNPHFFNSLVPCNSCEYSGSCRICPLQVIEYKRSEKCIEIDRRIKGGS